MRKPVPDTVPNSFAAIEVGWAGNPPIKSRTLPRTWSLRRSASARVWILPTDAARSASWTIASLSRLAITCWRAELSDCAKVQTAHKKNAMAARLLIEAILLFQDVGRERGRDGVRLLGGRERGGALDSTAGYVYRAYQRSRETGHAN